MIAEDSDFLSIFAGNYRGKGPQSLTARCTICFRVPAYHDVMKLKFALIHILLCCSLLQFSSAAATAFPAVMRQYSHHDGLSDNTVRNIFSDRHGYLWLSTLNGLNRFDGHRFIQPAGWTGDLHVKDIFTDKNGLMWIATSSGKFVCYDPCSGQYGNLGSASSGPEYTKIYETRHGIVYLWNPDGNMLRFTYNGGSPSIRKFNMSSAKNRININSLNEDNRGNLWLTTSNGIFVLNGDSIRHISRGTSYVGISIYNDLIHGIASDGSLYRINPGNFVFNKVNKTPGLIRKAGNIYQAGSRIYISHTAGCSVFDILDESISMVSELPADARFFTDNLGNGWIGDGNGAVLRIGSADGAIDKYHVASRELIEKVGYERYSAFEDNRGRRWIATYGNGVFCIDAASGSMSHYYTDGSQRNALPGNYILSVCGDPLGNIWVGTEHEGLVQIAEDGMEFQYHYPAGEEFHDRNNSFRLVYAIPGGELIAGNRYSDLYYLDRRLATTGNPRHFPGNIMSATIDKSQRLWLGLRNSGMMVFDGTRTIEIGTDSAYSVFDLLADGSGRIWCAMFDKGLGYVSAQDGEPFELRTFPFSGKYGSHWRNLETDSNGFIWASTNDGLVIFHPDSLLARGRSAIRHFSKGDGLPGNEIRQILRARDGKMWVAVLGVGILVCDGPFAGTLPSFEVISEENGLVNNLVQSLVEDSAGNMWVATERNLSRIDFRSGLIDCYAPGPSGNDNVFLENAAIIIEDGRLLFGTDHGLLSFDPSGISIDRKTTSPVLTDFRFDDDCVRADVSTMSFDAGQSTEYSFYLDGFDKAWSTPSKGGHIEYTGLPWGTYTLKVKARDKEALWSDEVSVRKFAVRPSVATYLYIALALLAVVAAYLIIRLRIRKRRNRGKILSDTTEGKTPEQSPEHDNSVMPAHHDDAGGALAKIIETRLADSDYTIEDFASDMNMSRSALYGFMKENGLPSPMEYLRSCRLERAAHLLIDGRYNVGEVANMVGMKDPLYFSRCFKQRFGLSPTAFVKQKKDADAGA